MSAGTRMNILPYLTSHVNVVILLAEHTPIIFHVPLHKRGTFFMYPARNAELMAFSEPRLFDAQARTFVCVCGGVVYSCLTLVAGREVTLNVLVLQTSDASTSNS